MGNKMNRIDGLQILRFGLGSRLRVHVHGSAQTPHLSRGAVDDPDRDIKEANLPGAVFGLLHADGFARKRAANMDQIPLPFDLAIGLTCRTAVSGG